MLEACLTYKRKHQVEAFLGLITFRSNTETVVRYQVNCTPRDNAPGAPAEALWSLSIWLVSNGHQVTPFCKLCCSRIHWAVRERGDPGATQTGTPRTLDAPKQFACCERGPKHNPEKNVQTCFVLLCT